MDAAQAADPQALGVYKHLNGQEVYDVERDLRARARRVLLEGVINGTVSPDFLIGETEPERELRVKLSLDTKQLNDLLPVDEKPGLFDIGLNLGDE